MFLKSLIYLWVFICVILSSPFFIFADEENNNSNIDENIENEDDYYFNDDDIEDLFIMEDMDVVEAIGEGADSGITEIPRDIIKYLPVGNSGITDMLTITPGVQFEEGYRSAGSAGEIAPANVSISGGQIYDNLFTIDGMSNSSLLDPNSDNPNLASDVPGNPQKFFLDTWLVEDITVYDSDISAKYGNFQGGVVDAKTKKPGQSLSGKISYKGTSNYLTNYFVNSDIIANFEEAGYQTNQLRFQKNFLSASLDIPITSKGGLLLSYNRDWSTIPLRYFTEWQAQTRTSETYYAKGIYNINGSSYIDASFSYSPYSGTYFIRNTKDSEFTINGGGYFTGINYVNELESQKITAHIDYSYSENSRVAPNEYKSWIASAYKDWGYYENTLSDTESTSDSYYSREGGFGSIDKEEQSFTASLDFNVKPLDFYGTHKINYGAGYTFNYGRYNRYEDAYIYTGATSMVDIICNGDTISCVDGDQYFVTRRISPATDVDASMNNIYAYVEENYDIWRIDLRLGLRFNYEDYMNNFTVAPRVRLMFDVFDNEGTVLTGGYNRYYSQSLLTYKLREGRAVDIVQNRYRSYNTVQEWIDDDTASKVTYNFSELDTPYTDEYTASINQRILGSYLNLKYVERHSEDGIALSSAVTDSDGIRYYSYNNNATSLYRAVQVKWSKGWDKHRVMANFTWSMQESSGTSYDDTYDISEMEDIVYYNGSPIYRYELPNDNFARPIILNVGYIGKFFDKRLTFSVFLKYRSPYTTIALVDEAGVGYEYTDPITGQTVQESVSAYEDVTYDHNVTMDLAIYWEQKMWKDTKLTFFVEVYNLFNTQNKVGYSNTTSSMVDDYELGTQIWLGVNYEF